MQNNQQQTPDGLYVASTVQASNINFSQLVVALIGFAGISLAAYFGLQSQQSSNKTNEISVFIESQIQVNNALSARLTIVEAENKALTQLNTLQTIQIASMKASADSRRKPSEIYADFVMGMPMPAWIKGPAPNNTFVMIQVNAEFTARYGKTQQEYVGETDYKVWPEDLAAAYQEIDREVVRTGTPAITQETTIIDGQRVSETSIKFRIMLENGTWGVVGFVFP